MDLPSGIEHMPIDALIPYARNARTHKPEQVSQIAASIREFGWTNPVLISKDNDIIAGHGRVMAARQLGMDAVPCIRLSHLTEAQRRALVIADNKLALNAGWDNDLLALELADLRESDFGFDAVGFSDDELSELSELLAPPSFEPGTEEDQGQLDTLGSMWISCPHCGKEFDAREQA